MIKYNIRNFGLFHTNFAEDLLEYLSNEALTFGLLDNCYVSEKIYVDEIFKYCKNKYNYKNDEPHYFDYYEFVSKLKPYELYFNIEKSVFIIPMNNIKTDERIVPMGSLKNEDIEVFTNNNSLSELSSKKCKKEANTTQIKSIKKKIFFFKGTRHNCKEYFNALREIDTGIKHKTIKLKKSKEKVSYDSLFELNVLKKIDNYSFIEEIKTQSLIIPFKAKIGHKIKNYIPDIQLLLKDGSLVIIEVKPFQEMVNYNNMRKHKALRKFCKENGFGFAIIDQDFYSFEELKKEKVSDEIQMKFIGYVKERGEVTIPECRPFKDKYNINAYQLCFIIWKNKKYLKYQQHKIISRKTK